MADTPRAPGGLGLALLIGLVLATRVLGLSLVLPGFRDFGLGFTNDLALVGFAFGAYGLSMAALQIPFGAASDRWGRRPAIAVGLLVSAAGSFAAAFAPTLLLLVLARLLQGAGAVNGVALALLGERTPDARRTTALAIAGAAIGVGFTAGLVAGAVLTPFVGVRGLFVANGVLVLATLGLVLWRVPGADAPPAPGAAPRVAGWRGLARALAHVRVLQLSVAAFAVNLCLHAVLFAFTGAADAFLEGRRADFALAGVVVAGGLVMFLGARQSDRGRAAAVARAAGIALGVGAAGVVLAPALAWLLAAGAAFFAGQSVLAALLPSMASSDAPEGARGAAQSGLQVAGYVGIVLGPTVAGVLAGAPAALALLLAVAGIVVALVMPRRGARLDVSTSAAG